MERIKYAFGYGEDPSRRARRAMMKVQTRVTAKEKEIKNLEQAIDTAVNRRDDARARQLARQVISAHRQIQQLDRMCTNVRAAQNSVEQTKAARDLVGVMNALSWGISAPNSDQVDDAVDKFAENNEEMTAVDAAFDGMHDDMESFQVEDVLAPHYERHHIDMPSRPFSEYHVTERVGAGGVTQGSASTRGL